MDIYSRVAYDQCRCHCICINKSQMSQASSNGKSGEEIASIGKEKVTRQEWLKKMEDRYGKATLEQMINQKVVNQLAKKASLRCPQKKSIVNC